MLSTAAYCSENTSAKKAHILQVTVPTAYVHSKQPICFFVILGCT